LGEVVMVDEELTGSGFSTVHRVARDQIRENTIT
jgi:hypothetical protein